MNSTQLVRWCPRARFGHILTNVLHFLLS